MPFFWVSLCSLLVALAVGKEVELGNLSKSLKLKIMRFLRRSSPLRTNFYVELHIQTV
ncbi:hypothetical protein NIES3974_24810 [Calothrix sp. NIES-3974]|nr:hypothetical protein NIES3974_24810 [Calothrix sp. NIES-3974]